MVALMHRGTGDETPGCRVPSRTLRSRSHRSPVWQAQGRRPPSARGRRAPARRHSPSFQSNQGTRTLPPAWSTSVPQVNHPSDMDNAKAPKGRHQNKLVQTTNHRQRNVRGSGLPPPDRARGPRWGFSRSRDRPADVIRQTAIRERDEVARLHSASSPVNRSTVACASCLPSAVRSFGFAPIARTLLVAASDASRKHGTRRAPPAVLIRPTSLPINVTACTSRPESVGYSTLADTTVVSERTFPASPTSPRPPAPAGPR